MLEEGSLMTVVGSPVAVAAVAVAAVAEAAPWVAFRSVALCAVPSPEGSSPVGPRPKAAKLGGRSPGWKQQKRRINRRRLNQIRKEICSPILNLNKLSTKHKKNLSTDGPVHLWLRERRQTTRAKAKGLNLVPSRATRHRRPCW